MIPHARLQPKAPMSISRTSSRPARFTLNEHVKVSTMINPNRISETRSMGSSSRLNEMSMFSLCVDPVVCGVVIMLESIIK